MPRESEPEKKMSDDELHRPRYPISVVAELLDIHPQTLRIYEREGLIKPARTAKNTRMFSEYDVEVLRSIISLTDIGLNLAGVELVLRMRDQIEDERKRFKQILNEIWERYRVDLRHWEDVQSTELIPIRDRKVARIKRETREKGDIETIDTDND